MSKFFLSLPLFILFETIVSVKDFKPAFGKWQGTITYLDYTSGKPFTMPCNVTISKDKTNSHRLILAYEYPNEPKANGNDTLTISPDGKMLDGEAVVSRTNENRVLTIIAERNGVDGNDQKKAVIRHIYSISKTSFIKRKEVKFEGEQNFIMRNEFKMSRR
jgi:hypothetical protein